VNPPLLKKCSSRSPDHLSRVATEMSTTQTPSEPRSMREPIGLRSIKTVSVWTGKRENVMIVSKYENE